MSATRTFIVLSALGVAAVLLLQALDARTTALRRDTVARNTLAALHLLLPSALSGPELMLQPLAAADRDDIAMSWRLVHRDTLAVMAVIVTTAARGYNDDIVLQVAVGRDGRILGSSIQQQHETPAYVGDLPARWQGHPAVDQLTGATITARAITTALDTAQQRAAEQLRPIPAAPP